MILICLLYILTRTTYSLLSRHYGEQRYSCVYAAPNFFGCVYIYRVNWLQPFPLKKKVFLFWKFFCKNFNIDTSTMVFRRVSFYLRPFLPVILGLIFGLALSSVIGPFLDTDEQCAPAGKSVNLGQVVGGKEKKSSDENIDSVKNLDYGDSDDFEPRIRTQEKVETKASPKKVLRPRYASTELEIKEKLFVGVVTSRETVDTFGTAVNKTLAQFVPKIVFFMNTRGPELPAGLSVVIFSNEDSSLVPYHMLKYIQDHYKETFDWYFLVSDETYTRGEKLFDMVNHMSISRNVYIGAPIADQNGAYCSLDGGILISRVRKLLHLIQSENNKRISDIMSCKIVFNTNKNLLNFQNVKFNCCCCKYVTSSQDKINGLTFAFYKISNVKSIQISDFS